MYNTKAAIKTIHLHQRFENVRFAALPPDNVDGGGGEGCGEGGGEASASNSGGSASAQAGGEAPGRVPPHNWEQYDDLIVPNVSDPGRPWVCSPKDRSKRVG